MSHSLPPPREVLAENLSILGFKPRNYTNAHYSGVVLNQDAFSGASNTKAFELISWFLFNKLDSHKAKKVMYDSGTVISNLSVLIFAISRLLIAGQLLIIDRNRENIGRPLTNGWKS
jgi:hypothetical protein